MPACALCVAKPLAIYLTRPAAEAVAEGDSAIAAHCGPSARRCRDWRRFQSAMLSLRISAVPLTDLRIAIHLSLTIQAFTTPIAPRNMRKTATSTVSELRALAALVNGPFSRDDSLDAPCPELIASVVAAVSVGERIQPAGGATTTERACEAAGPAYNRIASARSPRSSHPAEGSALRWTGQEGGELWAPEQRAAKRVKLEGDTAGSDRGRDGGAVRSPARSRNSAIGFDVGRRQTRSSASSRSSSLVLPETAAATVGQALVLLGADAEREDVRLPPICDTFEGMYATFAQLRRSWRGAASEDEDGEEAADEDSDDNVDGWPIADGPDVLELDPDVDGWPVPEAGLV